MAVWPAVMDIVTEIAPGANPSTDPGGWTWIDISGKARCQSGMAINQGRGDEAGQVDAGSSGFVLDDRSGDFATKNPLGQWYGLLKRNTPIRQRIRPGHTDLADTYTRTSVSSWGTATSGQAWSSTGAGGTLSASDFNVGSGVGTQSVPAASAYRMSYLAGVSETDIDDIRVTVTLAMTAAGGAIEPANLMVRGRSTTSYYLLRASISQTGQTISLTAYSPSGVVLATAGTGLTHAAGTSLTIVGQIIDTQIRVRAYQGSTDPGGAWMLTATDDEYIGPGWVGVRTGVAAGNTNTKPVVASYDNFSARLSYTVFEGFVPKWPPRWDKSRKDLTTPIDAAGVLRRMQLKNKRPLQPALNRAVLASGPVAYWPLDDGKKSTQAANAVYGGPPLTIDDRGVGFSVAFGEVDGPVEGSYPQFIKDDAYTGVLRGNVPAVAPTATWQFEGWFNCLTSIVTGIDGLPFGMDITGSNAFNRVEIILQGEGRVTIYFFDATGTIFLAEATALGLPITNGKWHQVRLVVTQTTSTTFTSKAYLDGSLYWTDAGITGTIGFPSRVYTSGYWQVPTDITIPESLSTAHIAIGTVDADHYQAGIGYLGETAGDRLARLFAEQGERIEIEAGTSEAMGPQVADTFINLIRECETTDGGVLYERRFGCAYQPRSARYNRPVDFTIDFATTTDVAEPPEPTDDDQRLRNYREVKRVSGSSAVAFDQASIDDEGLYDDSVTVNTATDAVLVQHAGWRLHLGLDPDLRWPRLSLDLRARPNLLVPWLKTRVGSRMLAQHQPFPSGPGDADVFQEGFQIDLGPYDFRVDMACSPARPYQVAVVEGAGAPTAPPLQVDTSGSSITLAVTSTATSLSVASVGGLWTTTATRPADFPFYCDLGGEQVQVTAIVGASSPQTFTVVRSINGVVKSQAANTEIRLWRPAVIAL